MDAIRLLQATPAPAAPPARAAGRGPEGGAFEAALGGAPAPEEAPAAEAAPRIARSTRAVPEAEASGHAARPPAAPPSPPPAPSSPAPASPPRAAPASHLSAPEAGAPEEEERPAAPTRDRATSRPRPGPFEEATQAAEAVGPKGDACGCAAAADAPPRAPGPVSTSAPDTDTALAPAEARSSNPVHPAPAAAPEACLAEMGAEPPAASKEAAEPASHEAAEARSSARARPAPAATPAPSLAETNAEPLARSEEATESAPRGAAEGPAASDPRAPARPSAPAVSRPAELQLRPAPVELDRTPDASFGAAEAPAERPLEAAPPASEPAPPPQTRPEAPTAARSVAQAILSGRDRDRLELRLDPPELGRVTIELHLTEAGVSASISAERPETLDMLRRHAELLQRELAEAGLDRADLSFSEREPERREGPVRAFVVASSDPTAPAAAAPAAPSLPPGRLGDRLDIRL